MKLNYEVALEAVESVLNNDRISNAQDAPDALERLRVLPPHQKHALLAYLIDADHDHARDDYEGEQ